MIKTKEILQAIPKTEIHLHLEGLASVETIWELKKKHNITFKNIETKEQLTEAFKVTNLKDFIDLFINVIQYSFQEIEDLRLLMNDAKNYLKRNNIFYAEIFFAITKFIKMGFNYNEIATLLDEESKKIEKKEKIRIRFLIDVSRGFGPENAMSNLDLVIKHPKNTIIGIGLGGDEEKGPAEDYKEVFEKAHKNKLHAVAHAGENVGPYSIWNSINALKSERIGHGISCYQDNELLETLKERQIPLEICPTSNFFTQAYATKYENHPIRKIFDAGVNVTVNTDDPTIFNIEILQEYLNLIEHDIFSLDEIISLIKNNLFATFLPQEEKESIWKNIQILIKEFA
ncbi:MAG: adenosine deaminase [Spirochaetales bacterium]|nr:adenosine deaminase [Spirochaetales bacterium]